MAIEHPKILIVDDKEANLMVLDLMLHKIDKEIIIIKALSGEEALKHILHHDFALAILDVQMPEMDGFELASYIRSSDKSMQIPCIFVTAAYKESGMMFKGYESGAVDFIYKPINENILLSKVKIFLELYERRKSLELEIEERKKLQEILVKQQEELRIAKEAAEEANRVKSQFLANMTHDFRTPLHVLIGTNDMLLKNKKIIEDPYLKKPIEMVYQSSERLLNLVNEILDLSKVESGKMDLNLEDFNLSSIFLEVPDTMNILLKSRPIEFKMDITFDGNIRADKRKLQQILTNLLGNAAKFTEQGEIKLNVYKKEHNLYFEVSDTGIGIKEADISKVFESFRQIENEQHKKYKGTGLGLSICKGMVEFLGGKMWVSSKFGEGSTFVFYIPYNEVVPVSIPKAPEAFDSIKNVEEIFKNKHILMCDDDQFNRSYAEMILKGKIQYTLVDNAFSAIERMKEEKIDLVFMDIHMPEIDGNEALKRIREINKYTPIVALTAQAMKGTFEKLIGLGFTDYLPKPFKDVDMLKMIYKHLIEHN
jgi:signal transduction histidine kinase